jgi:hypothetical protein
MLHRVGKGREILHATGEPDCTETWEKLLDAIPGQFSVFSNSAGGEEFPGKTGDRFWFQVSHRRLRRQSIQSFID